MAWVRVAQSPAPAVFPMPCPTVGGRGTSQRKVGVETRVHLSVAPSSQNSKIVGLLGGLNRRRRRIRYVRS